MTSVSMGSSSIIITVRSPSATAPSAPSGPSPVFVGVGPASAGVASASRAAASADMSMGCSSEGLAARRLFVSVAQVVRAGARSGTAGGSRRAPSPRRRSRHCAASTPSPALAAASSSRDGSNSAS